DDVPAIDTAEPRALRESVSPVVPVVVDLISIRVPDLVIENVSVLVAVISAPGIAVGVTAEHPENNKVPNISPLPMGNGEAWVPAKRLKLIAASAPVP